MNLESILEEWEKDAPINQQELGAESIRNAKMHSKYLTMLSHAKIGLAGLHAEKSKLIRSLMDYYSGRSSDAELKELGFPQFQHKLQRNEVDSYIQANSTYIKLNLKIQIQQEKVDALDAILKQINSRQFTIKNAIDWMRLMNGG